MYGMDSLMSPKTLEETFTACFLHPLVNISEGTFSMASNPWNPCPNRRP